MEAIPFGMRVSNVCQCVLVAISSGHRATEPLQEDTMCQRRGTKGQCTGSRGTQIEH